MQKSNLKRYGTIIGIVVVLVIASISSYNNLVNQQEQATTAWSNVETAYQRRADMMPQLVKIAKAYAKHEQETLTKVVEARKQVVSIKLDPTTMTAEQMKQFQDAQGALSSALTRLLAVSERYPDLKANENFRTLMVQEEGTENRISFARQEYNEAVQSYNTSVRRFPSVIFAKLFGFNMMEKFTAQTGAEKAPDLDL